MRLVSWNVNGLRACVKKGFVDWALADGADVICVQETKLQEGQQPAELSALAEAGYRSAWSHAEKKGYSGTATFSRVPGAAHSLGFGQDRYAAEGRTVVTALGEVLLVNGYFPNGGQGPERLAFKLDYYADLLAWCALQRGRGKSIVITGDLNTCHQEIDLARPQNNHKTSGFMPVERAWIDRFVDAGFVDTFRMFETGGEHYSWWSARGGMREKNVGWRLDYFLVSEDLRGRVRAASIHPEVLGSDHCPVSVELDL
jgi:exodeoxyribonuclease-3